MISSSVPSLTPTSPLFGWSVAPTEMPTRSVVDRLRAEPDVGEEADLRDRARDEREVRAVAIADPEPPLAAQAEALLADARDQLTAGRDVHAFGVATDLDVGVAVVKAGALGSAIVSVHTTFANPPWPAYTP